uniref:Uncharacterized protein n=2 Tax=Caenorhabditis japonica TaxID=281687 RepID=A0A8R1EQB3_CAEJA
MMLVDLPTMSMQKAGNLVLQGIAEGPSNPSIFFWNSIIDEIFADVEASSFSIGSLNAKFSLVSFTADQPHFRISFGLAAFMNSTLKPTARLVIVALMLLANGMYTDAPTDQAFYVHLTAVARWGLSTASLKYMTTKCHELVSHLPAVIKLFGNPAPLSTFAFEHFYKFSLKGFNPQMTKNFTETAASRVLLHIGIRREITSRMENCPTPAIEEFVAVTPEFKKFRFAWKDPILVLQEDDILPQIKENYYYFSKCFLPFGTLMSTYKSVETVSDICFGIDENKYHCCYRYIATCVKGDDVKLLMEKIEEVPLSERFSVFRNIAFDLPSPGCTYAFNLL